MSQLETKLLISGALFGALFFWGEYWVGIPGPGSRLAPPDNFSQDASYPAPAATDAEFPGDFGKPAIIDKRSVLRSSLVRTAPREPVTPIFALCGFPTRGSIPSSPPRRPHP